MYAGQIDFSFRMIEVHARIIFEIGFSNEQLSALLQFHHQRQKQQGINIKFRYRGMGINIFERIEELLFKSDALSFFPRTYIRCINRMIFCKIIGSFF